MLVAVAFDVGTLAGWTTVLMVVVVAFLVYKGGGGAALATLQTANDVLEKALAADAERIRTLEKQVAELTAKTDVSVAVSPVKAAIDLHETRSQERWERTLTVQQMIADELANIARLIAAAGAVE